MKQIESLFLGIIGALGALVVIVAGMVLAQIFTLEKNELAFQAYLYAPPFIIFAVLIEELSKYVLIRKKIATTGKGSVIINAVLFGLGFALTETLLIFSSDLFGGNTYRDLLEIAVIHISTAVIIAYALKKTTWKQSSKFLLALLPAIVLHGAYNFSVLYGMGSQASQLSILLSVGVFIIIIWSLKRKNSLA